VQRRGRVCGRRRAKLLARSNSSRVQLNKLTDTSRAHLFEIITQYRAIFTDDSNNSEMDGVTDSNILHSWLTHKVSDYLETLERYLPKISDGGSLLNILDQSMYLGMSLSRVGVEFRGINASPRRPCASARIALKGHED